MRKACVFLLAAFVFLSGVVREAAADSDLNICLKLIDQTKYKEAFPYCKRAAEQGFTEAQFLVGWMYHFGLGARQDVAQARKWYRKAGEQGLVEAQFFLGQMYHYGLGVQQDVAQAVKWYSKAAKQDHAGAQFHLGIMYHKGEGVHQDYVQAVKWLRKAAEQGVPMAQYNLGVMYSLGEGVIQSRAVAADWFYKAGLSFLNLGEREMALRCVDLIKSSSAPNAFLADKLLEAIYGGSKEGSH